MRAVIGGVRRTQAAGGRPRIAGRRRGSIRPGGRRTWRGRRARQRSDGRRGRRRGGARRAFRALALPHLDAAYNLARWLCGNSSDADDVVQEACMRALRFLDSCRGDNARPWLLTIVRHTWYSEWRRRANAHEVAADALDAGRFDGRLASGGGGPARASFAQ
ncbi:RNA polymerase sigma factor [Burkholderia pseudomallei Pakistan 9]|nr:RNA polymerase sigma factor [Burkholderia pseudomallei Pakistan 9]